MCSLKARLREKELLTHTSLGMNSETDTLKRHQSPWGGQPNPFNPPCEQTHALAAGLFDPLVPIRVVTLLVYHSLVVFLLFFVLYCFVFEIGSHCAVYPGLELIL